VARSTEADWVSRLADEVVAQADRRAPGKPIVCASGLSPSGPIHLGNLREVMVPHLVADELLRRRRDCVHLISWDDYDRFRRVPVGIDPAWEQHIGKPLTSVPAPPGSGHPNWAEHFKSAMIEALAELRITYRGISQTENYTSGRYRDEVLLAMRRRARIGEILARFRTRWKQADAEGGNGDPDGSSDAPAPGEYYPFKPYCSVCERDLTTITAYDDESTEMTYVCACGHRDRVLLSEFTRGKLVWKVDWPMRWAYEGVMFEPSGVDHTSPGSSFEVGGLIVRDVFNGEPPIGPMYAFVGITGMAKMSSSSGAVPTPGDALRVVEPTVLRWLYSRRKPNQSFKIAFDQEIFRLYDEWDALGRRVAQAAPNPTDAMAFERAISTAGERLVDTPRPVSYRMLASIADITTNDEEQMLRILQGVHSEHPISHLDQVRPRLDRAARWVEDHLPPDQHTRVLDHPDTDLLESLDPVQQQMIRTLLERLEDDWSHDGLSKLVYGVPKLQAGLALDAPPTTELKVMQRSFFALLYRLLVGRETGPRLPTLLLAIGAGRVHTLLGA
jgi:lysyl-tRNA synthetase class 1